MPEITQLNIFPIKSFDGVEVKAASLRANGSFRHDREYAFRKESGIQLNGTNNKALFKVRVDFDETFRHASFSMPGVEGAPEPAKFDLHTQAKEAAAWMSEAIHEKLTLERDDETGFCDEQDIFTGPTIISQATVDAIEAETSHNDTKRRLRSNVVIEGMDAFGEERLVGKRFKLGDLRIINSNPCVRCTMPARDPETAQFDWRYTMRINDAREKPGAGQIRKPVTASINTQADGVQQGTVSVGDRLVEFPQKKRENSSHSQGR